MKVVIQRAKKANVSVDDKIVGKIDHGLVIFVGFSNTDNEEVVKKMVEKIINLRIFSDSNDKMNLDIKEIKGSVLSVSQFTLYASLNGRRPSFTKALNYEQANNLYNYVNQVLKEHNIEVQTGIFGASMEVSLLNDGPVTIVIDSEEDL